MAQVSIPRAIASRRQLRQLRQARPFGCGGRQPEIDFCGIMDHREAPARHWGFWQGGGGQTIIEVRGSVVFCAEHIHDGRAKTRGEDGKGTHAHRLIFTHDTCL